MILTGTLCSARPISERDQGASLWPFHGKWGSIWPQDAPNAILLDGLYCFCCPSVPAKEPPSTMKWSAWSPNCSHTKRKVREAFQWAFSYPVVMCSPQLLLDHSMESDEAISPSGESIHFSMCLHIPTVVNFHFACIQPVFKCCC